MKEEQESLVNEITRASQNNLVSNRFLIFLFLGMLILCWLVLAWRPDLTGIQYPAASKIANCTYSQLETELNLKYSYARLQLNDSLIATDYLPAVVNWYKNNSVGPLGIKEENRRWEISMFGIELTRRVFFMPSSCLTKHVGSCASDTSPGIGIYSWATFLL